MCVLATQHVVQPSTHAVHHEDVELSSEGWTDCMGVDLVNTVWLPRLHPCSIRAYRCSHTALRLGQNKQTGRLNLREAVSVASQDSSPMVKVRSQLGKRIGILGCQSKEECDYNKSTIEARKANSERVQNICTCWALVKGNILLKACGTQIILFHLQVTRYCSSFGRPQRERASITKPFTTHALTIFVCLN